MQSGGYSLNLIGGGHLQYYTVECFQEDGQYKALTTQGSQADLFLMFRRSCFGLP
jgi:hypothetical protein